MHSIWQPQGTLLLAVLTTLWLVVLSGQAEASNSQQLDAREVNTGLDPTNLPSTYGMIFSQSKFATGDRLRAISLRAIHNFKGDFVAATIPILDFVPGSPTRTHATGLGDIRIEYFHLFRILTFSDSVWHGIGLELQTDSATQPQLGSDTTVIEPFYGLSYFMNQYLQLVFVARYLKDLEVGLASPIKQTVLLSPFAIVRFPHAWYASIRFDHFIDTTSAPNTFTGQVVVGKVFAKHYNLRAFYDFPLNSDSRAINVQARFGFGLLYQF